MPGEIAEIKIDRDLCIGASVCIDIAPDVFELDDQQKAVVVDINAAPEAQLREAAEGCPMLAIILLDKNGKQLFP